MQRIQGIPNLLLPMNLINCQQKVTDVIGESNRLIHAVFFRPS